MGKKALCLIFAFLLSINSFAAVVSDNDGSAFITKAEFDSLKNNFQSQIDGFNTSIDNKIDVAIASYLAGIDIKATETITMPYASWEKVTCLGCGIDNDYWYPTISLTTTMLGGMRYSTEVPRGEETEIDLGDGVKNRYGHETYWGNCQLTYERPESKHSKRLLCDAGDESSTYPDYIVWDGVANDYTDKITLDRIVHVDDENWTSPPGEYHGNDTGYLSGSMENGMELGFATRLYPGYFPNLENEDDNLWYPRWFWNGGVSTETNPHSRGGRGGYRKVSDIWAKSNALSIELDKVNDKTKSYEHIINYNNYNYDYFSDVDWAKTLNYLSVDNLTRESLLAACTNTNMWSVLEWWNPGHFNRKNPDGSWDLEDLSWELRYHEAEQLPWVYSGDPWDYDLNPSREGKDDTKIVSVGLIPKTYDSEHIRQTEKGFKQILDGKTYESRVLNLYGGLTIFAAKENDKIEWEPKFIDTYSNGVATNFELKIMLAMEPFGEGISVSSPSKYIIFDGKTTAEPITTTGKTCKIKFKMPSEGIIYAKWWPADASIESTNWEATLDLTQCGTYKRTAE